MANLYSSIMFSNALMGVAKAIAGQPLLISITSCKYTRYINATVSRLPTFTHTHTTLMPL